MKRFNTAGTCRPNEHYMVDIAERMEIIRKMVANGDYFCINRGRQYGKTTTLEAISNQLSDEYCVFQECSQNGRHTPIDIALWLANDSGRVSPLRGFI